MAVSEMASDDYHKLVRDDALELVQGHAGKVLDIGGGRCNGIHRIDRVVVGLI